MASLEKQRARAVKKRDGYERTVLNLQAQVDEYTRVRDNGRFKIPGYLFANLATAKGKLTAAIARVQQIDAQILEARLTQMVDGPDEMD